MMRNLTNIQVIKLYQKNKKRQSINKNQMIKNKILIWKKNWNQKQKMNLSQIQVKAISKQLKFRKKFKRK